MQPPTDAPIVPAPAAMVPARLALIAVTLIALLMLCLPGIAHAAKPDDVLICTSYFQQAISCTQTDSQGQSFTQVIWAPQGQQPLPGTPLMELTPGVKRLTLTGPQVLNGKGNGEANIIVGNSSSNELAFAGSGTYVIGNSSQTTVNSLRACRPSRANDCLAANPSRDSSENDKVELGNNSTNAAVYIDRTLEQSGECIGPLYVWNQPASTPGAYVLGARTYGQEKVTPSGAWTDPTPCKVP
jgi:hypothetical protein